MTTETGSVLDKEILASFSKSQFEPEWFATLRQKAFEQASELPLPKPDKTKIDKWNFTIIKKLVVESAEFADLTDLPDEVKALIDTEKPEQNLYIQRNHTSAFSRKTESAVKQGVIFTDIFTALREHPKLVKQYFMTADGIHVNSHKLAALHAAFLNGGIFIYVPKNVVVEEPIQAIFMVDTAEANIFNHTLIVADENAELTYVENYISTVEVNQTVANLVSEVFVGAGAKVAYGAVDTLDKNMTTYVHRAATVARDGKVEWALGLMNDGNTISENITLLKGDGSYASSKTVVIGTGVQKQNFTTKIQHQGKRSEGYILKHGVMKDEASSIFNGIGYIEHGASKSNAQQSSRVLMLSPKARGDANPMLLIDEDDVIAGHAASVGRVDENQLYYLQSRGITQREAERLIIHGFLAPVVHELPVEQVKKQLVEVIERKVRS
ncbi:MAG: sufD [Bacillales bacterium]|jgi:Fe-S cluster assembly protein SufD|nr:sufD [Bacillales bacterium]